MRLIRCLAALALGLMIVAATPAWAVDAVSVRGDVSAIDLTAVLEHQHSDTDRIQVSTAPGTDGIVRRIEVLPAGTLPVGIIDRPGVRRVRVHLAADAQLDIHDLLHNQPIIWRGSTQHVWLGLGQPYAVWHVRLPGV